MGSYRSLESVFFYLPVMIWFMRMSYGCFNRRLPFLPVCFVGVLIIGRFWYVGIPLGEMFA